MFVIGTRLARPQPKVTVIIKMTNSSHASELSRAKPKVTVTFKVTVTSPRIPAWESDWDCTRIIRFRKGAFRPLCQNGSRQWQENPIEWKDLNFQAQTTKRTDAKRLMCLTLYAIDQ